MGFAGQIDDPRQADDSTPEPAGASGSKPQENPDDEPSPGEEALVKKRWKEYEQTRKFDEAYRKQVAIDRRYAAGTSDPSWAVTTNVIGTFIDILTSLLYARNPDVSVRKAPQVDTANTLQQERFAKTLEIVISTLWNKRGNLKRACRRTVRSTLSVAEGWLKCTMIAEQMPMPEVETALNDARETHARLTAQQELLEDDPEGLSDDEREAALAEKAALIDELNEKVELAINRMFVIDFVKAEQMQVSADVDYIGDYLDANWCANEIYVERDEALERFPRLSPEDLEDATKYYQRPPKEQTTRDPDAINPQGQIAAEAAESYTTVTSENETTCFYRVVEQWDRRDKQIRTMMAGVKKWPKLPFTPPYPTSRFYPYFLAAFYEVDGARHPQSLSWRMYKLQDEFSSVRSNYRLARERGIPATIFNATMLDDTEARKIADSKLQEFIPVRPSDPATPLANMFAEKPVSAIDPRLFDVTIVMNDMERVSGVAEALQSAIQSGTPITATQANQQAAGTSARTTADRDQLEWMLQDLARYTAEQALQCIPTQEVMRMAGPAAFWPFGMDIEDLFTMVEVNIEAGSTGKPRQQTDQAAWGVVLPLLEKLIGTIEQARAMGNVPLANALTELVKETMLRMGDETDAMRFIPQEPPPGSPGAGAPPRAPPADVKVQIKGEIDPATALALVRPTVALDNATPPPMNPALQTAPGAPGGSPAGPAPPIQPPAPGVQPAAPPAP